MILKMFQYLFLNLLKKTIVFSFKKFINKNSTTKIQINDFIKYSTIINVKATSSLYF